MKSYKRLFRRFIDANPRRLHFAAHSHHFWPDVTYDAHVRAWTDAAALVDDKWDRIFGKVWPRAQRHVARVLRLPDPSTLAFGPNVHELVMRVLSNLPPTMRVLTTDGEFHSFARQLARFEEAGRAEVVRVPTRPFESFVERWRAAARGAFDLCYVSQVFFDSGYALRDLAPVVSAAPEDATVIVDGYHAFSAIDVDLSPFHERVFYVAGGYKYAMSGEGACFLHAPKGVFPRPVDTGWFAAFFALSEAREGVPYAEDGSRFLGATFDPTPLYRLDAVMSMLEEEGITTREIDERAKALQRTFVEALGQEHPLGELLVPVTDPNRGQFLVFESPRARELHAELAARDLMTDVRGDRLRVGFGLYHDEADVLEAVRRIASLV